MLSDQEHPQEAVVESATEPEDTAGGALSYAAMPFEEQGLRI